MYAFVDCDPYGIANIYRTLEGGLRQHGPHQPLLLRAAGEFLGVTPQDIIDFKLQEVDITRAKDALKNDPFFQSHKPWQKALEPEELLALGRPYAIRSS